MKKKMLQINNILKSDRLVELIQKEDVDEIRTYIKYEEDLEALQMELIKLQKDVQKNGRRVVIIIEGRDASGKGGAIRRFTHHLNPRSMRVVALPKPTDIEKQQWYFQRYTQQLPNAGEIVFFDRSWYNRAVVEPVMGFCTHDEHELFMKQVSNYEKMLLDSGIEIVKFWFSVSKEEQKKRFENRMKNPLKQWKISPVDEQAQSLWNEYTSYKNKMFHETSTDESPWVTVPADDKLKARLSVIRYVLEFLSYENKESIFENIGIKLHAHKSKKS